MWHTAASGLYRVISFSVQCALHKETNRQLYVSNITDVQHDLQSVGCRPPREAFVGELAKLRKATVSFAMCFCPSARNNSALTRRIFMKFDISVVFENLSRKFNFHYNLTRIAVTLHEALCTFMIISCSVLLRIRSNSHKSSVQNQNTHFI